MSNVEINAFGAIVKKEWRAPYVDDYEKTKIRKYGLELEKETGTTKVVVSQVIDTNELIQSYKDSCGTEACLKMIRSGLASPADFADDGKHGADLTQVPDYAGDLIRLQETTAQQAQEIKDALGIESLDGNLEDIVNAAVDKKLAEIQAQAAAGGKEGE